MFFVKCSGIFKNLLFRNDIIVYKWLWRRVASYTVLYRHMLLRQLITMLVITYTSNT